ncbi:MULTISPECIES: SDR family oxidoreductase [unclassified Lentimicrobium]|uniref:SDR family oxidoreductase n=1 Tax=unclassified Lentimicrobium TaxID=2677434 RepID=UPI001556625F|nr:MULTISPECIES: SDR family oxidoreductase [unclassified Lentimicrobium]NPD46171.1 SDR family oxidoreductase [Lentimicrobium sp. S6]NPD83222.1 SDR family oxidoreductase [Lentimicrobium sp. L6]
MKDKVVIITGASSGIGKALVYEYAKRGAKIVMAARNISKLEEIRGGLLKQGTDCLAVNTDVSLEKDCENLINLTVEKFGRIDILINNAGISMRALFKDLELDVLKQLMDVNFWGTVYCSKYALPYLIERKGSLVGVISIAGYVGLPGRTGYSASKFAVRGFLDTLRVENLKTGLHVLVAAPGFTQSNIRNVALTKDGSVQGDSPRNEGKMMTSEQVACKIVKAIDKKKAAIVLTFLEGKFTVFLNKTFPRILEKLTYKHMAKEADSPIK